MSSTRAQLKAEVAAKILSGNSDTTAMHLREFENDAIDGAVNKTDDMNVNGGYLAIQSGRVDQSFINSLSPGGYFLRDDGTWQPVSATFRVMKITTSTSITINTDTTDQFEITALAASCSISVSGSPAPGKPLALRITDDGTNRSITFDPTFFRFQNINAPFTTIASQTDYLIFKWNDQDSIWDCVYSTYMFGVDQRTGTAVTFDKDANYGTVASPLTGNITASYTGGKLGVCILIIHNDGSTPTFPAEFTAVSISGSYVTSSVNYIYCEFLSSTIIKYSICQ